MSAQQWGHIDFDGPGALSQHWWPTEIHGEPCELVLSLSFSFRLFPLDRMAAILQTIFTDAFPGMKILISQKFVPYGRFDDNLALVLIIVWRR